MEAKNKLNALVIRQCINRKDLQKFFVKKNKTQQMVYYVAIVID